jgi:hypothetical protein
MPKLEQLIYFSRGSSMWRVFHLVFWIVILAETFWLARILGIDHPPMIVRAFTNFALLLFAVPYVGVALLRYRRFGYGFWAP